MPPPRAGRLTGGKVTWLTVGGLGVVLLVFAVLSLGSAERGSAGARAAERSGDLAEAYLVAQDALSREDTIEDRFEEELDVVVAEEFAAAVRDFDGSMERLARTGSPLDRQLARRARGLHDRYAAAMRDSFAAVRRGDDAAVEEINDERMDPAQDELQPLVNGTGPEYAVAQLEQLDALERSASRDLLVTRVVVPIGALLYLLLVAVFAAQRRRLDRMARAEVERLRTVAHTDSLTGLLNHRALHRDLAVLDAGALVLLDVVGLKPVNDRRGHTAGDALLQRVAAVLGDEAAGRGSAYRIGGDEFAIVLPGDDAAAAHDTLDAVRARIADGHPAGVRGAIASGGDAASLLHRASAALVEVRRDEPVVRAA